MKRDMIADLTKLNWSPYHPLEGAGRNKAIPIEPGLYRIRRVGLTDLDYIGQSGMERGVRQRLGMLNGVYGKVMPYRDPHTVGPALWAMRDKEGCEYEASVCPLPDASTPHRKGLECVVIAHHRQEQRQSPTFSFGRMPEGYRMSSHNNARLVALGRRYRGGKTDQVEDSHQAGVAPSGPLSGPSAGSNWLGLGWSEWLPVSNIGTVGNSGDIGLYRLRTSGGHTLVYVGEGRIENRIKAHLRKGDDPEHRQYRSFRDAGLLEFSYVVCPDPPPHQRLEIETDLIGAHVLEHGVVPLVQFLG
jgi:hypothetical protein